MMLVSLRRALAPVLTALCSLASAAMAQGDAATATDSAARWAHVTYISGGTVYLDAGTRGGLAAGTHLTVVRDTTFVAELAVQYLSSTSAACTIVRASAATIVVGDSARYLSVVVGAAAEQSAAGPPSREGAQPARVSLNRLRGRIGVRYMTIDAGIGPAGTMSQPALDLRLDGTHLSDSPFGVAVDIRAQRSIMPAPDSLHPAPSYPLNVTRVYKAAVQWNPMGSRAAVTLGRQFSSTSSAVGMFDGVALDYGREHWSTGAFAGLQPSWYTFAFSDSTREYGAYVQWHNVTAGLPVWSFTVGGVGAYTMGQIDREFTYATAMVAASKFTAYVTQELDINRGWRAAQEGSSTTPTSTFATLNYSFTDWLSVNGGVDNRRNVRLYRDYVNPETLFDNSFRQGEWGGATVDWRGRFRVSGEARRTSGGAAGGAQSYTGSMGVMRLTPLALGFHLRDTHYSGQLSTGDLQSLSAEAEPFGLVHLEATGGLRTSSATALGSMFGSTRVTWTSVDADWAVGRSVYVMFSIYREMGSGPRNAQNFLSIAYRF
ncbi:MAG TPA: hypothetical protein VFT41_11410 [Gemmatimonadaceae bacterium]|nr:hypothetical protein [Gemmatimonadaceae bacterium]